MQYESHGNLILLLSELSLPMILVWHHSDLFLPLRPQGLVPGWELMVSKSHVDLPSLSISNDGTWRQFGGKYMPISWRGFMTFTTDPNGKCQLVLRTDLGKILI